MKKNILERHFQYLKWTYKTKQISQQTSPLFILSTASGCGLVVWLLENEAVCQGSTSQSICMFVSGAQEIRELVKDLVISALSGEQG